MVLNFARSVVKNRGRNNMKKLILISFICLIFLNVVSKFIFTNYELFNMMLVNFSILSSGILLYCLSVCQINDAYKIGLSFIFLFLLLVKFIISLLSPSTIENNYYFIGLLVFVIFEVIFLLIVRYMRKHA